MAKTLKEAGLQPQASTAVSRLTEYRQSLLDWRSDNKNALPFECSEVRQLKGAAGRVGPIFDIKASRFSGRVSYRPEWPRRGYPIAVEITQTLSKVYNEHLVTEFMCSSTGLDGPLRFLFVCSAVAYLHELMAANENYELLDDPGCYSFRGQPGITRSLELDVHGAEYVTLTHSAYLSVAETFSVRASVPLELGMSPGQCVLQLLAGMDRHYKALTADIKSLVPVEIQPEALMEIRSF